MQCWEKGPAAARMQRESLYTCSNGRAIGNNTGCNGAEDVGHGGLASVQGSMPDDQGDTQ